MTNELTATVKNGMLVITLPLAAKGEQSGTGKSTIVASTHGNRQIVLDGKIVSLGVNCYIRNT